MECFTEVLPGTKFKCVGGLSVFGSPPLKLRGGLFGEFPVTFDHVRFAYPTTPGAVIAIYIVLDNIVSSFAVYRWSERVDNVPASNSFWEYVDERFPDERMERIYENMVFD